MTQDRRENDKIILDEIRVLQKDINGININLALNTQETTRLAKYQELMNGRVAGHEARMQVVEGAQAITSTAVAQIQQQDDKRKENNSRLTWLTIENVFKLVFTVAIAYLLFKTGLN